MSVGTEISTDTGKRARRVAAYAAKLAAETIRREDDPRPADPADEFLSATFANCGQPAPADMYDEIRAAYAVLVSEWEDERYAAAKARYAALLARPDVAAVAARAATLTEDERHRLGEECRKHFRMFRAAQSEIAHRCGRAYSERAGDKHRYREVLYVADLAGWEVLREVDPSGWAGNAAADYIKVLLWGDLVDDRERIVYAGPWLAIIGEVFVSPWAMV